MGRSGSSAVGPFPGSARLKRRRLIARLFDRGSQELRTAAVGCIRILFRFAPRTDTGTNAPLQVGFAVPSRIKRATERNRIKRHMRVGFQSDPNRFRDAEIGADETLTMMAIFREDAFRESVAADTAAAFDVVARVIRQRVPAN